MNKLLFILMVPSLAFLISCHTPSIHEKLQNTIIDHVEFEDVGIDSMFKYLGDKSGIDFKLEMKNEQKAIPQAPDIVFDDIPLKDLMKFLCQYWKIKYKIESDKIIIYKDN